MLTNGLEKRSVILIVSLFFFIPFLSLFSLNQVKTSKPLNKAEIQKNNFIPPEIFALPPRVIQYPSFSLGIDSFSLLLKTDTPLDKVKFRISFEKPPEETPDFFTNNIQWKKEDKYFYLTSIYGKPAEIPIVENFFKLEVKYRFKPSSYSPAKLELLVNDKVIKTVPIDFLSPFEFSYLWNKVVDQVKNNPRQKIAGYAIIVLLLYFLFSSIFRRKKRKNIPVCSTRARFSTLIEENQQIKIEETNNPFGCRLGGLKKKVKIEYRNSRILIKISGKKFDFDENAPVDVKINDLWKLHMEAQNYFGTDNQSHKNLVILLLPI